MKGKLTKPEIHYIETNPEGLTLEELCEELGRSKPTVRKFLKKAEPKEESVVSETRVQKMMKEGFIKHGEKGRKGVSILTEGGAQLADTTSKARRNKDKGADHLYRPKSD